MNYGKYTHVLALLATIPQASTKEVRYGDGTTRLLHIWDGIMTGDQAVETMDQLLEYMHANFEAPPTANLNYVSGTTWTEERRADENRRYAIYQSEDMKKYRDEIEHILTKGGLNQEFLGYLETLPPYYSEVAFPVAVIRYMLRDLQMPINHRKSKHFSEFHNRYGMLILES